MYIAYSAMLLITPFRRVPKGWRYKHTTTVIILSSFKAFNFLVIISHGTELCSIPQRVC